MIVGYAHYKMSPWTFLRSRAGGEANGNWAAIVRLLSCKCDRYSGKLQCERMLPFALLRWSSTFEILRELARLEINRRQGWLTQGKPGFDLEKGRRGEEGNRMDYKKSLPGWNGGSPNTSEDGASAYQLTIVWVWEPRCTTR